MRAFADASILLAALAPVNLFLAWTVVPPTPQALNEYPLFLGLNVAFIAASAGVAVVRQCVAWRPAWASAAQGDGASRRRGWPSGSSSAGSARGTCAPSTATRPSETCGSSSAPSRTAAGARSFYEAVYHLLDAPPLPEDYSRHGGTIR